MFSRADWTLFRNLNTISQKAGVPVQKLRRLVLKELVDNALDCVGSCEYGKDDPDTYWVKDFGSGLNMSSTEIANLFSINRPLTSSKVLRLPLRGALGNGLRVVVGTVMASGGSLRVETNGKYYEIGFDDKTGVSTIASESTSSHLVGTKITVSLGRTVPRDEYEMSWANIACTFKPKAYKGKSSPYWYDSDSFFELLQSAAGYSLSWIVPQFEGMKPTSVGPTLGLAMLTDVDCSTLTRDNADDLLTVLRKACPEVSPKKLGGDGLSHFKEVSAKRYGEIIITPGRGRNAAKIPYVIEALASPINDDASQDTEETMDEITGMVNTTPITGKLDIDRRGATKVALFGCGLAHSVKGISKRKFRLWINVTTPYMPITTDGKEPNFLYYLADIQKAASKATKSLKSALKKKTGRIKDVILCAISQAIKKVSDHGNYRYSLRQLFYAIRPYILASPELGDLDYGYFAKVIGEYESDYEDGAEDLKQMYRDPRGTLYHPHTGESIPIGTIAVEKYRRPEYQFNKILYIEKEGLFEVLKQVRFPERFDCALLSSKGFASRAVRDVIDLLGDTGEPIQFFCIHDSDGPGTMIYQALQEGTPARAARRVEIINLGMDPWEARKMGLQVEAFEQRKQRVPVARYIERHDSVDQQDMAGYKWADWLQTQRVELNAMTSPQFVKWLEEKMKKYNKGKVVPPAAILRNRFVEKTRSLVSEKVAKKILAAAGFNRQVEFEMERLEPAIAGVDLTHEVSEGLAETPANAWIVPIEEAASKVANGDE